MSLLMDALRKAEEAKRQAAQKQQEDNQEEAQISVSKPSSVEDLHALEESLENDRELSADMAMPSPPGSEAEQSLDVEEPFEFDFDIDENFVAQESVAEAQASSSPATDTESAAQMAELAQGAATGDDTVEQTGSEIGEEDIDYIQPDELSRFTPPGKLQDRGPAEAGSLSTAKTEQNIAKETEKESEVKSLGLTLEDRAPDIERPSIIGAEHDSIADVIAEEVRTAEPKQEESVSSEPIRASRNQESEHEVAKSSRTSGPESKIRKTTTPEFAQESRKRESARAVFSAKHKGKDHNSRKKLIAAAAVIALFPLVGGGYLLLESMGIFSTGNQYNIPPNFNANVDVYDEVLETEAVAESVLPDLSPEPMAIASPMQIETVVEPSVAEVEAVVTPAPELAAANANTSANASTAEIAAAPIATPAPVASSPNVTAAEAEFEFEEAMPFEPTFAEVPNPPVQAASPINITRTDNAQRVDPQLTQAYASYRTNDFIGARARYQQVLRDKPNNRDAMLGLAAVAMRLGDTTSARESYIRLLELDPRDVHARAGLLETMPASDPVMLESELRALFAAHPEVAQLAFALGNHFASQRRWSDAQQSYYDALLAAKAGGKSDISPDYAFNLAVSLERLNQLRSAYTFYREALEQSATVPPSFDIRVLRERLDALERVLP